MKFFTTLVFILLTVKSFAQQKKANAMTDTLVNVDNMPVVRDNATAADMPIHNGKGNATDMPTARISGPNQAFSTKDLPVLPSELLKKYQQPNQDSVNPKKSEKRINPKKE